MPLSDAKIIIKPAPNRMRAVADYVPSPTGIRLSAEEIENRLIEQGITVGIKAKAVDDLKSKVWLNTE